MISVVSLYNVTAYKLISTNTKFNLLVIPKVFSKFLFSL